MPVWTLVDHTAPHAPGSLAGYGVYDALGQEVGTVTGWVRPPDGSTAFLLVALCDWRRRVDYLLPAGWIARIEDASARLFLRRLTRASVRQEALPMGQVLPDPGLLDATARFFPRPTPPVAARLNPGETDRHWAPSRPPHERPSWTHLHRLTPLSWRPLHRL